MTGLDPDGPPRLGVALVSAWLAWMIGLGALYAQLPPSPDQSMFDYVGWVMAEGGTLYVDAGCLNWPGKMLLHAASSALFGNTLWSWRVFDWLMLAATSAVLFDFGRREHSPLHGVVVGFLYPAMYATLGYWFAGQRDVLAAHFVFISGWAMVRRWRGGPRWWVSATGPLVALAVLTRPTYLLFPALFAVADLVLHRRGARGAAPERPPACILADQSALFGTFAATLAVVVAIGAATGSLAGWYDMAFRFTLSVYGQDTASLGYVLGNLTFLVTDSWHWYTVLSVAGLWCWWRREGSAVPLTLTGLLLLTALVSYFVQGKGLGYHLGAVLLVFALLIAAVVAELVERARRAPRSRWGVAAAVVVALVVGGSLKKISGTYHWQLQRLRGHATARDVMARYSSGLEGQTMADILDAVAYVRAESDPAATVLTWSRPVALNHLAQRRLPTRFMNTEMLVWAKPPFALAGQWADEFEADLRRAPPEWILMGRDLEAGGFRYVPAEPSEPVKLVVEILERDYAFDRAFGSGELYRRRR